MSIFPPEDLIRMINGKTHLGNLGGHVLNLKSMARPLAWPSCCSLRLKFTLHFHICPINLLNSLRSQICFLLFLEACLNYASMPYRVDSHHDLILVESDYSYFLHYLICCPGLRLICVGLNNHTSTTFLGFQRDMPCRICCCTSVL
jgi:hypothetical protein